MRANLDPRAATAASIAFDSALPYVFAPGAEILEVVVKWDGRVHPTLRTFSVTAKVQAPGAPEAVEVSSEISVNLTSDGWTNCLFTWWGLKDDPQPHVRYYVNLNAEPEPTFRIA
ncbi:MAG TPA: hypothetical protein VGH44_02095 [Candidatus Saccharimonadia bacterium]|jgi:hypothetical protein